MPPASRPCTPLLAAPLPSLYLLPGPRQCITLYTTEYTLSTRRARNPKNIQCNGKTKKNMRRRCKRFCPAEESQSVSHPADLHSPTTEKANLKKGEPPTQTPVASWLTSRLHTVCALIPLTSYNHEITTFSSSSLLVLNHYPEFCRIEELFIRPVLHLQDQHHVPVVDEVLRVDHLGQTHSAVFR